MRISKIAATAGAALVTLTIAGVLVAWITVGAPKNGRVAPNVTLGDIDVSNFSAEQLTPTLSQLASAYGSADITIGSDSQKFVTSSSAIGLAVDSAETARRVMAVGRNDSLINRFGSWVSSLATDRPSEVVVTWNNDKLYRTVASLDPGPRIEPTEPTLRFENNVMAFESGKEGRGLSGPEVAERLPDAAADGLPLKVTLEPSELAPRFTPADLQTAFEDYRKAYVPIQMTSGTKSVPLVFETLQPWLRSSVRNNAIVFDADVPAVEKDLPGLLPNSGVPVKEAGWEVIGTTPRYTLGTPGSSCCEDRAATNLRNALFPIIGSQAEKVDLGLRVIPPKVPTRDTSMFGIQERVATFSTSFPAGQPRVKNIHRISDLVRGAVIAPGETFSLNAHVGPRTIEKGFVSDGVIEDAVFKQAVGGGISQFSTTLFNTAFFAGLDWEQYQAHSIYISRYPYGREATVSFPWPDQKIKNSTPHGILIWPTYSSTSVTVDFYSTKFVDAEQTGQSEEKAGECTRVKTERTRRYLDGRVAVDAVFALYQPAEGVRC